MRNWAFTLLLFSFVVLLSACSAASEEQGPPPTATWTPPPTRTALPTETMLPSMTPSLSPSATMVPAEDLRTPEPPTDLQCATPKSLMLHSAFGFQRMRALADAIEERGWQTITYRDVLATMQAGKCPPENSLIVSIDDLGTNWLRADFIPMVETFIERDMVLVLGAVVEGPQDPEVWELFKEWQEAGVEIASHSLSHYELPALTDVALEEQVAGSYAVICENLGTCPITFILTFGKGADDPRIVEAARDFTFLISIQGGRSFGTSLPYILGRVPPNNDDQTITLNVLDASFGEP